MGILIQSKLIPKQTGLHVFGTKLDLGPVNVVMNYAFNQGRCHNGQWRNSIEKRKDCESQQAGPNMIYTVTDPAKITVYSLAHSLSISLDYKISIVMLGLQQQDEYEDFHGRVI